MRGHQNTLLALSHMLESGRFPHAILFHGPKGIGKRLLAGTLATRLICGPEETTQGGMFGPAEPAQPLAPNTQSPQFAQLQAGSCPDFHTLEVPPKRQSIGVDAVRELLATLARTAETTRVIIVDAVDDLTPEAANMLLKTLEEPRPGTCFLLISHSLGTVLPTIRSRCRLMRLSPLSPEDTHAIVAEHGGNPQAETAAPGCPGQVLSPEATKMAEYQQKLATWQAQEGPRPPIGPGQGGQMVEALLATLATSATLQNALAYQKLSKFYSTAQTYNLPLATLAESTMDTL